MRKSKRIVVDASVGRSAGWESSPDAISRQCREALEGILRICHRAVFSQECLAEWRRHRSGYARRWLVQMFSRRKVILAAAIRNDGLRARLVAMISLEADRAALEKDAHLIEAAIRHDHIVLSRDEAMRQLLRAVAVHVRELKTIQWVNPATEEGIVRWLEEGAKAESSRRLGAS